MPMALAKPFRRRSQASCCDGRRDDMTSSDVGRRGHVDFGKMTCVHCSDWTQFDFVETEVERIV
jgi:hypothetical protein